MGGGQGARAPSRPAKICTFRANFPYSSLMFGILGKWSPPSPQSKRDAGLHGSSSPLQKAFLDPPLLLARLGGLGFGRLARRQKRTTTTDNSKRCMQTTCSLFLYKISVSPEASRIFVQGIRHRPQPARHPRVAAPGSVQHASSTRTVSTNTIQFRCCHL